MSETYTIGKWSGMDNYLCQACPFATLNEVEMRVHVMERHIAPVKILGGGVVLVADASGNEVERVVVVEKPMEVFENATISSNCTADHCALSDTATSGK